MSVNLNDITLMSREIALQHGRGLTVAAVVATEGGSDRVEVIVTIEGCHQGACQFVVNVSRANEAEFNREFKQKLSESLAKHAQ
jgi:hypothetical protein